MIEAFRNEIVDAAKSRTDLLKWKLILVSALAAIGLGISNPISNVKPLISTHLALCLIPIVCVYVDLLCKHLQIRILAISEFFQSQEYKLDTNTNDFLYFHLYEKFCNDVRTEFNFEDWAQQGATIFLSALIITAAFILSLSGMHLLALVLSGVCGIVFTWLINKSYRNRCKRLRGKAQKLVGNHEV